MMAKTIDWATLVNHAGGPKQNEPTYQFGNKQFTERPKPPGESTHSVDSNIKHD